MLQSGYADSLANEPAGPAVHAVHADVVLPPSGKFVLHDTYVFSLLLRCGD